MNSAEIAESYLSGETNYEAAKAALRHKGMSSKSAQGYLQEAIEAAVRNDTLERMRKNARGKAA